MGTREIAKYLFKEILKRQLKVTKEYFNSKLFNLMQIYFY